MSTNPTFTVPHDPLTPLDPQCKPSPAEIRQLRKELYDNAQAITTSLGGGQHGHLGLLMPAAEYANMAGAAPYAIPAPPVAPDYTGATTVEREAMKDAYSAAKTTYNEARAFHNFIKAQIIKAVPELYIGILADDTLGYATVTPKDLLAHLVSDYGKITPKEIRANLARISAPWDPATPIEQIFINGTRCCKFAADGNDPICDAAYVRILVDIFTASGVLDKAVEDWEDKPEHEQTPANARIHFTKADNNRTSRQAAMKDVLRANTAIVNGARPQYGIYCWSHGICTHSSQECKHPAEGHCKTATIQDIMGGCLSMTRPPGYKPVFKPKPNTGNRNRANRDKKDEEANPVEA